MCFDARAGSMILNCFLLCTLDRDSYIRFGIWSAFCVLIYLFYSLHSIAYHHEEEGEKLPQFKCAPSPPVTQPLHTWPSQPQCAALLVCSLAPDRRAACCDTLWLACDTCMVVCTLLELNTSFFCT